MVVRHVRGGGVRFATTVGDWATGDFQNRSHRLKVPRRLDIVPRRDFHVVDEVRLFGTVLRAGLAEKLLLLYSSRGTLRPELVATILLGLVPRRWRATIVLYGEMFEPNRGLRRFVERVAMRLLDRSVVLYAVHSKAEVAVFADNWQIDPNKVRSTGFFLAGAGVDPPPLAPRGDHVFAGGTSFRDYDALMGVARLCPERRFVVCTDQLDHRNDLPMNVDAGLVSPERFDDLLRTAGVVVVPLQTSVRRIVGMLTYLRSMWHGTPTICSRALGADEFIDDGETGLLVQNIPESYARAINWVFDPANSSLVDEMCGRAQRVVATRFRAEYHAAKLLAVVDEAAEL